MPLPKRLGDQCPRYVTFFDSTKPMEVIEIRYGFPVADRDVIVARDEYSDHINCDPTGLSKYGDEILVTT